MVGKKNTESVGEICLLITESSLNLLVNSRKENHKMLLTVLKVVNM